MHIKNFFESKAIKDNYGVDYDRGIIFHGIPPGYIVNERAKVVLRISYHTFDTDEEKKLGYCYKVEALSNALYSTTTTEQTEEIVRVLKQSISLITEKTEKTIRQEEILKAIRETYSDSTKLGMVESMILNSLNEILK